MLGTKNTFTGSNFRVPSRNTSEHYIFFCFLETQGISLIGQFCITDIVVYGPVHPINYRVNIVLQCTFYIKIAQHRWCALSLKQGSTGLSKHEVLVHEMVFTFSLTNNNGMKNVESCRTAEVYYHLFYFWWCWHLIA